MEHNKQTLLKNVQNHIRYIQEKISADLETVKKVAHRSITEIGRLRPEDQTVAMQLRGYAVARVEELTHLYGSPYFVKCVVEERETREHRTYYFAKHQLSEESIYSWIAPIAAIRFENLGPVSYTLPSGEKKDITLLAREQYMITNGKVFFFAREETDMPRALIYQEHFTVQKSDFVLPEIVAQMEKAQDQVIRAHHFGPLVISGPAGSGKTTLALHRVAYLAQAPETSHLYTPESMIVFVQDNGTKEYFSHLLPELGIYNVTITTFAQWAMKILDLEDYTYVSRYGEEEEERDLYEYQKITVLRTASSTASYQKNPFVVLSKLYGNTSLFSKQKKEKVLDRFDLTILLRLYYEKYGKFETKRTYNGVIGGVLKIRTKKTLLEYSLVVMDEFQNYLPEQFEIIKSCLKQETNALIYVGDMAQQVYLGTIKKWEDIGEVIEDERKIKLDKVYRNTRSILEYIQSLSYSVSIPNGIKEGPDVLEKVYLTAEEEIEHIKGFIEKYKEGSVGILAKDEKYLRLHKEAFANFSHVHVLTMNESQGVEFDFVCIVGIHADTFTITHHADVSLSHIIERQSMQRDLLYVALTRAITELHVLGVVNLKDVVKQNISTNK